MVMLQGEFRYWWSDDKINNLFSTAKIISAKDDYEKIFNQMETEDIINYALQRRPDTKYVFVRAVNLRVKLFPLENNQLIGAVTVLPAWLRNSKSVLTLLTTPKGDPFTKPDCGFRCLAAHLNGNKVPPSPQRRIDELKKQFANFWQLDNYDGSLTLDDLEWVEMHFDVRISVYESTYENGQITAMLVRRTNLKSAKNGHMHLDLTNDHFSLIKKLETYCNNWRCENCEEYVTGQKTHLQRHQKTCEGEFTPKPRYSKLGRFRCRETIFTKLVKRGIEVEESLRYCHSFSCFDLESCRIAVGDDDDDPCPTAKRKYLNRQEVFAASISSTVEGYEEAVCFRTEQLDPVALVKEMLDYMLEISAEAASLEKQRLQPIFNQLDLLIEEHSTQDTGDDDLDQYNEWMVQDLEDLKESLEKQCSIHVFYSFNIVCASFSFVLVYSILENIHYFQVPDLTTNSWASISYMSYWKEELISTELSTSMASTLSLEHHNLC